ncbi:similar to Saccharomyces cerevisiae YDL135C RDI1 Rho GDP dissociation inhibitor involved in the localization and regulation of Cdc42p and Rho1p [Maudiozyma barnettii]|uniref:Rho GDP-dissociation inhibitor n=1 Tax=Maudiozyma barnettii TaxID=61262 RepID=A0A8H2ZFX6_9SACH|nr:Rdi1p [Kazachstania barnettii]CAB4252215.1 similar to Saccharomyces cerevisiae YDL135C RDI1 Rho GDP dissociation inhibitor involved in the localization and regulation of Cdc42p and Rho1p [Kazachstania barnettii]CAD1778849.1 similar to Saccharomyces cerevisiae YDL135C RDI1 Rho GDP dissociation inhibitor involved in the localization and regulation of Cdc42p and Rho1p [Kazachstania barnettii]
MATENTDFKQFEDEQNNDGYKVGEKKTVDEYKKLDAEDAALAKWKESLGLGSDVLPLEFPGDKRKVVIQKIQLLVNTESKPISFDLTNEQTIKELASKRYKIKENSIYKLRITFKVQHEIITGLRYVQYIKKAGIAVDKIDDHLGSYAPSTKTKPYYEVELPESEAPSGLLARGKYSAVSKFIDDDKTTHLTLNWGVEIVKK